jgi:CxxC motif-containing protein (DUF1111 family)
MAVMETVKTYFENLPVDRRRAYLDKNIAKTKELFEKIKKRTGKNNRNKIYLHEKDLNFL